MRQLLLIASSVIIVAGVVPYAIDVLKKKTKPRIVTWFNWSLLTGIATVAAISEKQYTSALLTLAATLATFVVFVFGLRYGDRKFTKIDVICQIGAILGLLLWAIFDNPTVAIVATVSVDLVAGVPTYIHAWKKPYEETITAFLCGFIGGVLSLLAVQNPTFAGLVYPVYLPLANLVFVCFILFSPHKRH